MAAMSGYLQTGQTRCYDDEGRSIPCGGSGQDARYRKGQAWPSPRFLVQGEQIEDRLTGLAWSRDANPSGFPLTWQEALDFVAGLNGEIWLGASDWRLPNRRELHSLLSFQTRRPALPEGHPFSGVFPTWRLPNINELESLVDCGRSQPALPEGVVPGHVCPGYWSSTTSLFEPDWAWALYARDGGIGVGQKGGRHFHVWTVRDGEG